MTKQQIIEQITELTGIPRSEVRKSIEGLLEVLTQAFTNGQSVYLRGFGTFNVVQRVKEQDKITQAMVQISKTDAKLLIKYLSDAAAYYRHHGTSAKEHNRARLLNNMAIKIRRKNEL